MSDSIPELKAQLAAAVQERDMARALADVLIRTAIEPLETQLDKTTAQVQRLQAAYDRVYAEMWAAIGDRDRLQAAHDRVCEGLLAAVDLYNATVEERDRARACAVALEQELAQVTVPPAETRQAPAGGTAPTEETTP